MENVKLLKNSFMVIFLLSLILTAGSTNSFATEWTTYVCYFADTTSDGALTVTYLRPEVHYDCLSFSLSDQVYSIMDHFVKYNSVFDYESIEGERDDDLNIYLKTKKLSKVECQELITTLLIHGFKNVTIIFSGGSKRTYSKKDIDMPFLLPVYFKDEDLSNDHFIKNASEMLHLACEANLQMHPDMDIYQNNVCNKLDGKAYDECNNLNIVLYVLFGISVLLNVCLLFSKIKQSKQTCIKY